MRSTATISICMLVRGENRALSTCLESVRGLADEVIVGNLGTSRRTEAVGPRDEANMIQVPWRNDLSQARNQVISSATCDWILVLNPEEWVALNSQAEILGAVRNESLIGYRLRLVTQSDPAKPASLSLRLFRNIPEIAYRDPVAPRIDESILEASRKHGKQIGTLQARILSRSDAGPTRSPGDRLIRLLRGQIELEPESVLYRYRYAEHLRNLGRSSDAIEAFRKVLRENSQHFDSIEALADLLSHKGSVRSSILLLQSYLRRKPEDSRAWLLGGTILTRNRRFNEAIPWLEEALRSETTAPEAARLVDHIQELRRRELI